MKIWKSALRWGMALLAMAVVASAVGAQTPARFIGTVTALSGDSLTVKTDAGQSYQVTVPASAVLKRIEPGERDLSKAVTMALTDLAVGDRTLVKVDPDSPAGTSQALQIIAVKSADVAKKQQAEREDWQKRGVGGLVKSVDAAGGLIVLTSGSGSTAKTITVHVGKTTMLKRYAPASVSFELATPAPIDGIHAGDQVRARGTKSADGLSVDAEEVISGTFRNISGVIESVDASGSIVSLKDLTTKKQMTIHITPAAQMRRIPERMAMMLAMRMKGGAGGSGGGAWSGGAGGTGARTAYGGQGQAGGFQAGGGQAGGGDPNRMLSMLPAIQLADLKKGDAVMLVATDGTTDVTAITLLAGVEPLLEAPAASQSLLNNWSMGSGGDAAAAAAQ
jgi:uncharacterized membrane protein YgcG